MALSDRQQVLVAEGPTVRLPLAGGVMLDDAAGNRSPVQKEE